MGCIFDAWETPYCVKKVLEKQFAAHQEQQLIENGRDTYAGHIGRAEHQPEKERTNAEHYNQCPSDERIG